MVVNTALMCLALNVYFEARSEPIPGQYAVALVTLNRAKGNDERICREVFKKKQFSWTNGGSAQRTAHGWRISGKMLPKEAHAWWVAQRIAQVTLSGKMPDFTQGSQFYHTTQVRPVWRLALVRTKKIGQHQFYTLPA